MWPGKFTQNLLFWELVSFLVLLPFAIHAGRGLKKYLRNAPRGDNDAQRILDDEQVRRNLLEG
jgi:hypothetical protein